MHPSNLVSITSHPREAACLRDQVEGEEYTSLFFAHPIFLKPSKLASHSKGEDSKAHSVRAIRIGASEIRLVKQDMVVRVDDEIPMSQSHRVLQVWLTIQRARPFRVSLGSRSMPTL